MEQAAITRRERLIDDEPLHFISSSNSDGTAVSLLNHLMSVALDHDVSDVHFEWEESEMVVRFRHNGDLKEAQRVNLEIAADINHKIRAKARSSMVERQLPQDGKILVSIPAEREGGRSAHIDHAHSPRRLHRLPDS